MHNQLTLLELKRRGDEAFLEAQAAIDTAREIVRNCRALNADLRRTRDSFRQRGERSLADLPASPPEI